MYSMYLNGEGIQVIHQPAAHTDGDTIVFFRRGDVIATGDIIDTTRFPVIDVKRGGSVQGELDALNRLMDLSILNLPLQWYPDRTFLVPGHGHVYDKLDLLEYRDAVTIVRDSVQDLIDAGQDARAGEGGQPDARLPEPVRRGHRVRGRPTCSSRSIYNELAAKKGKQTMSRALSSIVVRRLALLALGARRRASTRSAATPQPPPPAPRAARADRSHRLLGVDRHAGLALAHGDARQRRLPGHSADARGAERSPTPGIRRRTKPPASSAGRTARPR